MTYNSNLHLYNQKDKSKSPRYFTFCLHLLLVWIQLILLRWRFVFDTLIIHILYSQLLCWRLNHMLSRETQFQINFSCMSSTSWAFTLSNYHKLPSLTYVHLLHHVLEHPWINCTPLLHFHEIATIKLSRNQH